MDAPVRRYHPHWPGFVYTFVTLLIGVGALNSQNNLLFLLFGIGLAGFVTSGLLSGQMLMAVEVRRVTPRSATAGRTLHVRYEVRNRSRFVPLMGLTIEEMECARRRGPRARPSLHGRCWSALMSRPMAFVAHVGTRSRVNVSGGALARERGAAVFERVRVSTRFPFGVMRKSVTFSQRSTVIVRPAILEMDETIGAALRTPDEAGALAARTGVRAGEFHALRGYVPGDPIRSIAWKASARADDLVVREHARPSSRRVWVELRLLEGDGAERRQANEHAISVTATVLHGTAGQGLAVGLIVPGHDVALPPAPGQSHLEAMLDALALLDVSRPAKRTTALAQAVGLGSRDEHLVISAGGEADGPEGGSHIDARSVARAGRGRAA